MQKNYTCHTWVNEERIVVGTDAGKILFFESGELKAELSVAGVTSQATGSSTNVAVRYGIKFCR